jgi:hypothetical protein
VPVSFSHPLTLISIDFGASPRRSTAALRASGGCSVPLEIQIQPLCMQLDVVARAPIWRRRQIRGAPVGTIDSAPVMFTNRQKPIV